MDGFRSFTSGLGLAALAVLPVFGVAQACAADQTVRVGIMSAEDEDIWSVVSQEALKRGLTVIVAKRLSEHLDLCGFVVMSGEPTNPHSTP
jgi:ABC-type metal ion transport system substrate-binding protein